MDTKQVYTYIHTFSSISTSLCIRVTFALLRHIQIVIIIKAMIAAMIKISPIITITMMMMSVLSSPKPLEGRGEDEGELKETLSHSHGHLDTCNEVSL